MIEDIYNYLPLTDALLTSGMPTAEQLEAAANAGVKMVINLAPFDPAKDVPNEEALAKSLHMEYLNIPVEWEHPTPQDLGQFMDAMDAHRPDKLLVHCRANHRVSTFVALYRIRRLGWKREDAFRDLQLIWNPDENAVWKKFIAENLTGS